MEDEDLDPLVLTLERDCDTVRWHMELLPEMSCIALQASRECLSLIIGHCSWTYVGHLGEVCGANNPACIVRE